MSGSWGGEEEDADEVEFTDTDEVKCQYAQWNDSITHGLHATRCQKACRADYKRRTSMKKTRGKITPCDVIIFLKEKKKKKPWMVEGPVDGGIVTYTLAVVNISISPQPNERATREHARNEKRSVQLQKKNNLLSVASIHFHSKRQ